MVTYLVTPILPFLINNMQHHPNCLVGTLVTVFVTSIMTSITHHWPACMGTLTRETFWSTSRLRKIPCSRRRPQIASGVKGSGCPCPNAFRLISAVVLLSIGLFVWISASTFVLLAISKVFWEKWFWDLKEPKAETEPKQTGLYICKYSTYYCVLLLELPPAVFPCFCDAQRCLVSHGIRIGKGAAPLGKAESWNSVACSGFCTETSTLRDHKVWIR